MSHPKQPQPNNDASLEASFIHLVSGKRIIILHNDPPSTTPKDDYVVIRNATTAAIEDMSTPDLLVHYANILAIETKIERYTGPQWDALVDGLDTLRICSELFSSVNNHELGKILAYICH